MSETRFRHAFLILLVVAASAAFIAMIRDFLLVILLAAVFSSLSQPLYQRLRRLLFGHGNLAAVATLVLVLALVLIPLVAVLAAGASEALRLTERFRPDLQELVTQPGQFEQQLSGLPGYRFIEPYRAEILTKVGELLSSASAFALTALTAGTKATAVFVFQFFVLVYTMFFFLTDGSRIVQTMLAYLPIAEVDKERMVQKFVSVTRATLKGTVLIGTAQGVLSGIAFAVVGIDGAIFWGTVMTIFSIVPGIGGALVWVPAVVILAATGHVGSALGLAGFCAIVVGTIDNLMRPRLVGKDTQMHELLIFFSTLGGLLAFGAMGFIVGPILAALFVTTWEMFGTAFRRELGGTAAIVTGLPPSA
jgi:predicted PurR-regulated permease PerM